MGGGEEERIEVSLGGAGVLKLAACKAFAWKMCVQGPLISFPFLNTSGW